MHPSDDLLNAYADGSIDPSGRADVERHVGSCAACRQTVDEVRAILGVATTLELREPPARAWSRIERAIALDGDRRPAAARREGAASGAPMSRAAIVTWLAAAAAIVVATMVGLRYVPAERRQPAAAARADATDQASAAAAAQAVEAELRQAEAHYENAIKGLEQIANAEQSSLDPRTAATLQKNLAVIDQAIGESRAAVRAQPASEPAQQSLIENFKTKIGLLQDTVALINEMRKGNEAGAAQIVSGLKQKGD